ncbi:MAG: hypothetical protein KIT62_15660 [Cyclobacteriaceae bacterium]|nr:hypothetical protein [Cyclobacteriaceae bacterium]
MSFKNALLSTLIIEVSIGLLAVINYGASLESLQAVTRFSGRVSLAIFSIIFLFHNHRNVRLSAILSDRYFLILAIAHAIHLAELLSYILLSGNALIPVRLAGGFLAYSLIFFMPYAHWQFKQNRFPVKTYSVLSLVYLYYVWFVFFMTYLPRVRGTLPGAGGSYTEFVVLLAWVSFMLGIKLQSLLVKQPNR